MSRARILLPTFLLLAGLSCEVLDNIQQDPSFVQNPDPVSGSGQEPGPDKAATFQAELNATGTAIIQQHDATRTAAVGTEQGAKTEAVSPTPLPTLTATPTLIPNRPPVITKFTANFVPADRTTYYAVTATDSDSKTLTYRWSNTNSCGTFEWDSTQFLDPAAAWFHPHPPCPDERFHPAIIAVIVSDGQGNETYFEYPGGSASGEIVSTPSP